MSTQRSRSPTQRYRMSKKAHPEVQEGWGGPPKCPRGLERPTLMSGSPPGGPECLHGGPRGVRSPSSRSGMGREANPKVRKAHPEIRQDRVAHAEVWKVHPEVREGSGGPPGGPEGLPGGPGGVRRPTWRSS